MYDYFSVLVVWFCYKRWGWYRENGQLSTALTIFNSSNIMKFAFALLSIAVASALRFVGAGPVDAEGLVSASIFSSQISGVH